MDRATPRIQSIYIQTGIGVDCQTQEGRAVRMVDDRLTYRIIGCAMEVHKILGNGFQEVVYQRCLAIEMESAGLSFGREVEQPIFYRGVDVGTRRADFIVANQVVVELKALTALEDVHIAQAKNYLVAYDFEIGLLINFGANSLEYRRIFNDKKDPTNIGANRK